MKNFYNSPGYEDEDIKTMTKCQLMHKIRELRGVIRYAAAQQGDKKYYLDHDKVQWVLPEHVEEN